MTYNKNIVVPQKFKVSFETALSKYKIIFLGAFTGYGKSSVCLNLLSKGKAHVLCAEESLQKHALRSVDAPIIVLENLHTLKTAEQINLLLNLLQANPAKQFILLSRSNLPEALIAFEISGVLHRLNADDLLFGASETAAVFATFGITISAKSASFIASELHGNPMAISLLAQRSDAQTPQNIDTEKNLAQVKWDIYRYLNGNIFDDLNAQAIEVLLCAAELETFSVELLNYILPTENLQSIVINLVNETFFVTPLENNLYCCASALLDFFKWKIAQTIPQTVQTDHCNKAAEYYYTQKNYVCAVFYYHRANNKQKVIELLEICSLFNPAIGYFKELEPYFNELSNETICSSGSLIAGMAMLCVLHVDYDGADDWYFKLKEKAKTLSKNTAEYKKLQEKIIYLDLACPHRETTSLQDLVNMLFKNLKSSGMKMQQLSISSCLPSVLNGGRDFSEWVKKDDLIYHTMKKPVEYVLDAQGVGLPECAYCESKFEKCLDYHTLQVQMMSTLPDIQHRGTIDTEFATVGLLSRIQLSQGKADSARETLMQFAERVQSKNQLRLMPNLKAMLCHIALCSGDVQEVEHWFLHDAPADLTNIWILWRLQYRVKAEILIYKGQYSEALILLSQLLNYAEKCRKILDLINFTVLIAIAHYRMGNKQWQSDITKALDVATQYGYVHPIAQYGKAVLALLLDIKYTSSKQHFDKILRHTRIQASFYQNYLQASHNTQAKLSNMELQVLALICQDRSNQEIADILGIKLSTVKTHVSNILRKLEIKRRSEAKTEAKKRNLIENFLAF